MKNEPLLLDRAVLRAFLDKHPLMPVTAAEEGRFILPVPDFGDGKGPLLTPNVKELEARLRGSDGTVEMIELEAGPQKIPADGTNVVVINRVDVFVQMALSAKLEYLIDGANGEVTRGVVDEFMGYARGYTYDPATGRVAFARNAGFRNDVYNMPISELKKRYVRHSRPGLSLEQVREANIRPGYYVKKPLPGRGAFLEGAFRVKLSAAAGGAVQDFGHGAMVNYPEDPAMPLSFIHVTDINTCYVRRDGGPIVDARGRHSLPRYDAAETQKPLVSTARQRKSRRR
jgi:hypothetical protein